MGTLKKESEKRQKPKIPTKAKIGKVEPVTLQKGGKRKGRKIGKKSTKELWKKAKPLKGKPKK